MDEANLRPPPGARLVLLGTGAGLFRCWAAGTRYTRHLQGMAIHAIVADPRDGSLLVAANAPAGPSIWRSADSGATWMQLAGTPTFPDGRRVSHIWQICPGHPARPGELWAGTREAGLFRSTDLGATWRSVTGLNDHRSRFTWDEGGGGLILHTIIVHPGDPARIIAAISAGGIYRSDDGGATWRTANCGVRPDPRPDHCAASGQCPHRLRLHPSPPHRIYQQGHCGVYRSDDFGERWEEISAGLPSPFGWPLALDLDDPDTLYVVPHISDKQRWTTEGRLAVWRSRDGGGSWERLTDGLPAAPTRCLRESLATAPSGHLYLGTVDGRVFWSEDAGERWALFAQGLPAVQAITTAVAPA
jgi:hypothetical protein